MNKYGIENFKIEELEYVEDDSLLSDKEIYWIKELETYGSKDIMLLKEVTVQYYMIIKKLLNYIVWDIVQHRFLKK